MFASTNTYDIGFVNVDPVTLALTKRALVPKGEEHSRLLYIYLIAIESH